MGLGVASTPVYISARGAWVVRGISRFDDNSLAGGGFNNQLRIYASQYRGVVRHEGREFALLDARHHTAVVVRLAGRFASVGAGGGEGLGCGGRLHKPA